MTCAAYQSCFILSANDQEKQFNVFGEDSVPETSSNNKDGNGLATPLSKKKWMKKNYTIPMVTRIESNDSTAVGPADSTEMISVKGMKRRKGK